jgi:hypothetical protein
MNAAFTSAKIGCARTVQRIGNWKRKGSAMSDDPILKCLEYHASAGGEYTYWGEQALIKYAALKADADRMAEALKRISGQYNCLECSDCTKIARAALAAHEAQS